jgi:hypothetical protein
MLRAHIQHLNIAVISILLLLCLDILVERLYLLVNIRVVHHLIIFKLTPLQVLSGLDKSSVGLQLRAARGGPHDLSSVVVQASCNRRVDVLLQDCWLDKALVGEGSQRFLNWS